MANLNGFDAGAVEPSAPIEAIPPGDYVCMATDSEWRDTKAGTGRYLQLTFSVIDGQYKGRKLWARLNLENPNSTAVDIARRDLSALCRAVGVMKPGDSSELHGLPVALKVAVRKRQDTGELTNEIKGFKLAKGVAAPAQSAPPAQNANGFSDAPPWARG